MIKNKNMLAIGRSRYLYAGIRHLASKGYKFKAIITEEAYEEYDIKSHDFERLADELGADFFSTKTAHTEEIAKIIKDNSIAVAISANWKYTLPKAFLDLFECGILNFHLGNLPDYKGNATVNWTLINGEHFIYGNIHKMDPELDAGNIIARKAIPISYNTYIADILKQAQSDAPFLYEEAVEKVLINPGAFVVKGSVSGLRCYPRLPEDSQIKWEQSAEQIYRLIRASSHPYKGAFSFLNGEKVVIWKADIFIPEDKYLAVPGHVVAINKDTKNITVACKEGMLQIQEIGHNGKVMPPAEYIKSVRVRFKYLANAGS
jgi:methionyl-tRNA formyltransferase